MNTRNSLSAKVLGQIALMQSVVAQLPDKVSMLRFACQGLKDVSGVENVDYRLYEEGSHISGDISEQRGVLRTFFIEHKNHKYADLVFDLSDIDSFSPYIPYIENFSNMLAVMLEEQRQRTLNKALMADLEQRVFERTQELELEIQERKLAEEALRESEERQRGLLNNTSSVIYIKDVDGRYLFVNRMYETLFHISDEAIQGKLDHDMFPSNMADAFRSADLKAIESDMPLEFEEIVPQDDGEHIYISVKFPLKDSSGTVYAVCGISTDITKRKQAEEELRHLRNYLSNIIDSMPSVLIGVDVDGQVTLWNKTAEQITGIAAAAAQDKRLSDVFPRMAAEMETIIASIRKRETKQDQKMPRQSQNGICYEDVTIYPLIANGVAGAIIRIDDVTDKVRMEEMMIQSEKMLSVGGLAAGMAHEINNPLAGMMQTASVMKDRLTNLELPANLRAAEEAGTSMAAIRAFMDARGIIRMLGRIHTSGRRAAEIVANMLSFARKGDSTFSTHNLAELLDQIVDLAGSDYDLKKKYDFRQIEILRDYEEDLPFVPCESGKLQQVFLNILRNGAEAMQAEAEQKEDNTPRFILRLAHKQEAGQVRIEIEDNGPGMDEATRKRVFEPFFTTKPVGVGTGLGLSVSYFIITENHGGAMSVESAPGKGTTFSISLPVQRTQTGLPVTRVKS